MKATHCCNAQKQNEATLRWRAPWRHSRENCFSRFKKSGFKGHRKTILTLYVLQGLLSIIIVIDICVPFNVLWLFGSERFPVFEISVFYSINDNDLRCTAKLMWSCHYFSCLETYLHFYLFKLILQRC